MIYLGYVTPKQFIDYLAKQLKAKSTVKDVRKQADENKARIIVPSKPDSDLVICVSAKFIDMDFALLIECVFGEIVFSSAAKKYLTVPGENWECGVFGPYQRKQLRRLAQTLAHQIHEYTYLVQNMDIGDCFVLRFDDVGENSPRNT